VKEQVSPYPRSFRLFGSRQALLREAGCTPAPTAGELILEAAPALVGRRGLAELSMDELADAAGVSRATLYRLFPGKPALFSELIRAYSPWETVAELIDTMPDGRPEEVVPAVGRAMAEATEGRIRSASSSSSSREIRAQPKGCGTAWLEGFPIWSCTERLQSGLCAYLFRSASEIRQQSTVPRPARRPNSTRISVQNWLRSRDSNPKRCG
jgi:AcrR family transcriptional regulator